MKISKIYIAGSLLLATTLSLTSCSDQLNALPSQSKVDGTLVVDQKSANAALNGVYYKYAMCGTDNYDVKSTGCSNYYELTPADLAGVAEYYQGPYVLETHDAYSMTTYASYSWDSFYATISATNAVIEEVGATSDDLYSDNRKAEILGEAYCMRALSFYNVLRYFGYSWDVNSQYGALLRTSKSVATTLPISRSTVAETYDQILADVDYAIVNAPSVNEKYYVTSWFAKGLKARVLMMRGQGTDYDDAASLCADIINNGPYTLEDNYADIFHQKGLNSSEVIFGIQPKENQTDVIEQYYYRGSAQFFPTESLMSLYTADDTRKDNMYLATETEMIGFHDDGSYYIYNELKNAICKHMDPDLMEANDIEESQYQMRLSEIYLLRAEALARTGNLTEAKSLLTTVMSKAGITDFSAVEAATTYEAVMKQIFNEGLKNLSFECGLEHDMMIRFPESITLDFNPYYETKEYNVFPIPTDEFRYNSGLTSADQNPGYSAE